MPAIQNIPGHCVTLSTASETITANTVQLANTVEQTVTGLAIRRLRWAGNVSITQGNTALSFPASTAGEWYLEGIELNDYYTANVSITITGAGTCILELDKLYT
jgi:hypothetical protein